MSDGSEFHRSDAATGKERRPTVVSRNQIYIYRYTLYINIMHMLIPLLGVSLWCPEKFGG